jgi:hypothetical protein
MQDLFVDRLANVMLVNNVARLDFIRFDTIDPTTNQGTTSPSLRVAIPLEGLIDMAQQLDKLREQIATEIAKQQASFTTTQ